MGEPEPIGKVIPIMRDLPGEECPVCHERPMDQEIKVMGKTIIHKGLCKCKREEAERRQKEWEEEEKKLQAKQKQARIETLFNNSGLGKRFKNTTFNTWQNTPETDKAFQICKAYVDSWPEPKKTGQGLILIGPLGTGKTHLVAAILNDLISRDAVVVYENAPELLLKLKSAMLHEEGMRFSMMHMIETLSEADLLIIDDIGTEKWTEWIEEQLYIIINKRYCNQLPIIVTTNLTLSNNSSGPTLLDAIGQRSLDRLIEICDVVRLYGSSYRIKKREAEAKR